MDLYYDSIADDFLLWMNEFDLRTRLEWFEKQIRRYSSGGLALDVGSGLGHFSQLIARRGGRPVSLDISPRLLGRTENDRRVRASALRLPFADGSLPLVVSSECIEHTPDPIAAVQEMVRVLRPGGVLMLTCPNRAWRWTVPLATRLGLRYFSGLENWPSRHRVRVALMAAGADILVDEGLYLLPFQLRSLWRPIAWLNRNGQILRGVMINQCWVARRCGETSGAASRYATSSGPGNPFASPENRRSGKS